MLSAEIRSAAARILRDPRRIVFFLRSNPLNALYLRRFFVSVLPLATAALEDMQGLAEAIPDDHLRAQARSTLETKAYHVAGACVLATFLPSMAREHYIKIVAPLEVIYDYLDTLCDRNDFSEQVSRSLHEALFDALDPARVAGDYFAALPQHDDGEFLRTLVGRVRFALARLAGYEALREPFAHAARLYTETQTFKHLPDGEREPACMAWFEGAVDHRTMTWYEYTAAAGSQFHVYGPLYAAFAGRFDCVDATYRAYFPAVAAIHVMLDSFIDRDEDAAHGELSLAACYPDRLAMLSRMRLFAVEARAARSLLPMPAAHEFALRLMELFYLSHPKIRQQRLERDAVALLRALDV